MSGNPSRWIPKERNYKQEKEKGKLQLKEATEHPLVEKPVISNVTKLGGSSSTTGKTEVPRVTSSYGGTDPLTGATKKPSSDPLTQAISDPLSSGGFVDPLSALSPKTPVKNTAPTKSESNTTPPPNIPLPTSDQNKNQASVDSFIPWKSKKVSILQEFTTNEVITVSFIDGESGGKPRTAVERTQQRLSELDQTPENQVKETLQVTQKDYEKTLERMHEDLVNEWTNGEKVKALKIAIQCAKLLADVTVVKFYPSKFVLITEILDTFGKSVYDRIGGKADSDGKARYLTGEISPSARETCRNWFYKIASIRELIPRLYIEMAILSSYRFIHNISFPAVINRIASQIRGIGNPLVAMYARTYLARKGYEVEPSLKDYVTNSFYDYLEITKRQDKAKLELEIKNLHVTLPEYLNIYSPALDWQLQCIGAGGTQQLLLEIFDKFKESKNPVILKHIISSFNPELISRNAKLIVNLIKEIDDTFPKYQLFTALGVNLVLSAPPKEEQMSILQEVWRVVTNLSDPKEYITVAEVYIEYPLKHCTPRDTHSLLTDILKHVKVNNAYENLQPQLLSIVTKVVSQLHDFSIIFNMDSFVAILDLFGAETQVDVNKSILSNFSKYQEPTSDPIIISTMFNVGKVVHDSVNSLSFADEVRQISKMLASFINKIEFGIDLEKHLNFLVECRRAFGNLDAVKNRLVLAACNLAMKTLRIIKGKHTKKTSAFVRACISFCFITVPTIEDVLDRLNLYLLVGQVSTANQALSQADSMFKSAIKLIQEVPPKIEMESQGLRSTEEALVSFLRNFLSTLIIIPGHPEQGPFYLVKGLLKVVSDYPWETTNGAKIKVYMSVLALFSVYYQPTFPLHVAGVESNDVLYFRDEDYMNELQAIINKILEDILAEISKMKEDSNLEKALADGTLDFFNHLLIYAELNAKSATLAFQLYDILKAHATETYKKNTLAYLQQMEGQLSGQLYNKLKEK